MFGENDVHHELGSSIPGHGQPTPVGPAQPKIPGPSLTRPCLWAGPDFLPDGWAGPGP
jgi:hypothetical protein